MVGKPESTAALILIADWGDNCGEDACGIVKIHQEAGLRYTVHVVGLAVSGEARQELVCIAEATGGAYRDAASEAEVLNALDQFAVAITASAP
jgi:Ca-activated chloride channel family protein